MVDKVYVVTEGEYSSYSICAVFSNRENAEFYCALGKGECVEEYDVIDSVERTQKQSVIYRFHVTRPSSGTSWVLGPAYILGSAEDSDKKEVEKKCKQWERQYGSVIDNPNHFERYVWIKENNKSLARKIVQDRIAKAKAIKEGL